MKKIILILSILASVSAEAQNINWNAQEQETKKMAYLNFGYDYGIATQIGFGYKLKTAKPIFLSLDYSNPMGDQLLDDQKIRIGAQMPFFKTKHFIATAKAYAIVRRQNTDLVRIYNVGSELSVLLGYYKTKWHIAGEVGLDKSNQTHLKHSQTFRDYYANVQDGWYKTSGGNYYYGLQGGRSLSKRTQLSLRAGATNAFANHQNALLPVYFQLGLMHKF